MPSYWRHTQEVLQQSCLRRVLLFEEGELAEGCPCLAPLGDAGPGRAVHSSLQRAALADTGSPKSAASDGRWRGCPHHSPALLHPARGPTLPPGTSLLGTVGGREGSGRFKQ